jgi:hypothetical protein
MATINPFQGPINYSVDVQSPFEAALGGFKLGAAGTEMQQVQQKRAADIEALRLKNQKQLTYSTGLTEFFKKPPAERKYGDLENLFAIAEPEQITNLQNITKTMDANKLEASKRQTGQLLVAFEADPKAGKAMLQQRFDAETDPNQKAALKTILDIADLNPDRAANLLELQGAEAFGKSWYEGITAVREQRRVEKREPSTLAELENKAFESGIAVEFARPKAEAELAKLKAEKLAPSVQEALDYENLTPEQQKTFSSLQIAKKPAGAVTNVNVNNLEKTAEGELGKLLPDLYNQANSAATQLTDLPRYRKALGAAITGPLANLRLDANRIGDALGFTGDKKVNATRELIQGLAEMGLKSRSMLTGQGAITDSEQALLLKARSGDITFSKGELDVIFNVAERAANAQYSKSKKLLSSAATKSPTAQMFLDNVEALPNAPPEASGNTVKVGGQTYTRPAEFTDEQWNAYKKSMGL